MKKLIPLIFGLMLPLSGAFADNFVDQAVEFCRSKGGAYSMGSMVEEGNKYCRQVTCKKTTSDRLEIPEGAPGPEANVEATKRVCVDKSIVDGSFNTNGSGSGSGSSDAGNSTTGSSSGAATTGAGAGTAGAGAGGADSYICEELIGEGRIEKGGLCYNECRPKRAILGIIGRKKEGFERKSCVECLLRYPGVYSVKAEYLPKDKNGKVIGDKSVSLGKGVGVKTGVIICKDSKGNIVHINGTMCPPGSVVHSGTISTGSGGVVVGAGSLTAGSAGGAIIIAGSAGGSAGIQRPAYCDSSKKKDLKKCEEWMNANRRFLCASSAHAADCIGSGSYHETMSRYDTQNCVNCGVGSRKQSTLSGIAEIVGAIAPPLAQFGSAYVGARAYQKGQEAWAGAAVKGFEQCQISQNNYMQYLSSNELPGLSPAQQAAMGCNGFQLGGFAGMQNPGLSGWYGAGYTPGMIGGMMGPWGGYDPYGGGMMAGGMMAGGMMTGGYPGGMMAGGMVNGISIAGGINSGMAGGYPGGMIAGGMMAGGYPGGMMAGGYPGGMVAGGMMAGGYPGGMMTGGYPGGMMTGGMVNGISIAGGVAGGYPGGMMTGGYYPGGMMTGGMVTGGMMAGGMMAGGYYPGGMMAGGMAVGGMAGGYPGGMMAGGMMAGGMSGGFMESQQAANYDAMLQQQGMGLQVAGGGMGTPYGAGGYPMNGGYGTGMYGAGW